MKKTLAFVFGIFTTIGAFAATNEKPLGSNVTDNTYSVDKQYAKADSIKVDNKFYNLKQADKVAINNAKTDKFYSLIDIYELAAEHNAEYLSAQSTFASNVETVPKALGGLLPQIDATYNLRGDNYNQFGGNIKDFSNGINFNGSQMLFDWTRWKTFTQATYLQKSYAMIYAKAEQDVLSNTITAYFELLRAYQILQFQYANEAWNKKLFLTQQRKYEAGVVDYADLKTSNAQYEQAVATRADAQKSLINAKATMARLIGKKIDSILYVAKDTQFNPPTPNNLEYWLDTAQEYNLDISQREFEYQAAGEGVGLKWGNFFPNAYLSGGIDMSFNEYRGAKEQIARLPTDYKIANITGTANWNLLKGGSDFAELKQASYNNQAANYAVLQMRREVYAGTLSSFETVTLDSIRIDAYKKSVYAGLASVKAILDGYEAGTQTIVDLLNRQATLVQSQLAFSGSIFDYIEHYAELKKWQGSLAVKDIQLINTLLGEKNIISEIAEE